MKNFTFALELSTRANDPADVLETETTLDVQGAFLGDALETLEGELRETYGVRVHAKVVGVQLTGAMHKIEVEIL